MAKVDDSYENERICIRTCGNCPSYPGIIRDVLFCARGKSSAPRSKAGCNCGQCDVWDRNDLSDFYYCMAGEAE